VIDPQERLIRRSWWALAGSLVGLGLIAVVHIAMDGLDLLNVILLGLVLVVACAAMLHRNAVRQREVGRRAEAESVARILRGLSRSVSPDAIVDAIVEELGVSTGADHIVVVRRGADPAGLVARLVSTRPGVGTSTTRFPLSDLEDPIDGGRARPPVAVPIVREIEDRALVAAPGRAAWVAAEGRGRTSSGLATAEVSSARSRVAAMAGAPGIASMSRLTGRPGDGGGRGSAGRLGLDASHEWLTMARGMGSTARARLAARARAFVLAAPDAGEEASAAPVTTPTGAADERVAELATSMRCATRWRHRFAPTATSSARSSCRGGSPVPGQPRRDGSWPARRSRRRPPSPAPRTTARPRRERRPTC
jgi:hypothetical protein